MKWVSERRFLYFIDKIKKMIPRKLSQLEIDVETGTKDYEKLENKPTKLSQFENDLYYNKRELVLSLTKEDFVEQEGAFIYGPVPKFDWLKSVSDVGFAITLSGGETVETFTESDTSLIQQDVGTDSSQMIFCQDIGFALINGVDMATGQEGDSFAMALYADAFTNFELYRVDSKKVPIEFCDTSEIEAEIDTLIDEVNDL